MLFAAFRYNAKETQARSWIVDLLACFKPAIGIPPIRINTSIQKSHSNAYAMIGRHAWRLQSLQSLLLTAQHTQRYDFSLQDVEPIWAPVLDSSSKWLVCKFPRGNSEGNWTQCFEDLLRCDLHTQKCKKCCKMLQRDQKGMYIRGLRAHRHWWSSCTLCRLYTSLHRTGSTREISCLEAGSIKHGHLDVTDCNKSSLRPGQLCDAFCPKVDALTKW